MNTNTNTSSSSPARARRRLRRWSKRELAFLERCYPRGGAPAVARALKDAGLEPRTTEAIYSKAHEIGVDAPPKGTPIDAVLQLVLDYRGMPLGMVDVQEELPGISKRRATALLEALTQAGHLAEREGAHNARLWYDPRALAEAA